MKRTLIIPGIIVLAAIFGAAALMATGPQLEPAMPEPVAASVRVQEVRQESIRLTVHAQGTVSPNIESELVSEVSGQVVWKSPALVNGGSFDQGDPLLRIEDRDYRAAVERAQAGLTRAEAEYEHNRFEHQRLESLEARQLVSRSMLENAQRAHRVSEAALQDARVALAQAERDLARTELRAPFRGLVRRQAVDIGQFVSRGNAVATLYASAEAEVRLPIADRQLAYLDLPFGTLGELPPDQQPEVLLDAEYAGRRLTWRGRIVRTEAAIDTSSRMIHVVARVNNDEQPVPLSVGLFVSARIEGLMADDVVRLPRTALHEGNRVLVVDEDNRLRYRPVELLRLHQDEVLIRQGLLSGERVCISPLQTVVEGMPVIPLADIVQIAG